MSSRVDVPPSVEPLSLAEVKQHLVIEHDEDDAQLMGLIQAAREQAEEFTARAFISQTRKLYLAAFPPEIELPYPPLQSVVSIEYQDDNGNPQTVAASDYEVDATATIGTVRPLDGWPSTSRVYNGVVVTYVAGYGDAGGDVPAPIRHGLLVNIADLYEQRGAVTVGATVHNSEVGQRMLGMYRVRL